MHKKASHREQEYPTLSAPCRGRAQGHCPGDRKRSPQEQDGSSPPELVPSLQLHFRSQSQRALTASWLPDRHRHLVMSFLPSLLVGGLVCFHLGREEGGRTPQRGRRPCWHPAEPPMHPSHRHRGSHQPLASLGSSPTTIWNLQVQEETRVQPKAGLASKRWCKAQLQLSVQPLQKRLHFGAAFLLNRLKTLSVFSMRSIGY